jgi:hypothetical protein
MSSQGIIGHATIDFVAFIDQARPSPSLPCEDWRGFPASRCFSRARLSPTRAWLHGGAHPRMCARVTASARCDCAAIPRRSSGRLWLCFTLLAVARRLPFASAGRYAAAVGDRLELRLLEPRVHVQPVQVCGERPASPRRLLPSSAFRLGTCPCAPTPLAPPAPAYSCSCALRSAPTARCRIRHTAQSGSGRGGALAANSVAC